MINKAEKRQKNCNQDLTRFLSEAGNLFSWFFLIESYQGLSRNLGVLEKIFQQNLPEMSRSYISYQSVYQVEVPSGSDLWSDQVQRTRCVPRLKLQGLGFVRVHNSMIRGHFGLGMAWSEVTSGWEWSDQRRIQAHISLIREDFERNWVWSDTISSGTIFFWFFVFFYREMLALPIGNQKQLSDQRFI